MFIYKITELGKFYFCSNTSEKDKDFYMGRYDIFSNDHIDIRNAICLNHESIAGIRDNLPIIEVQDNTKITKTDAIYVYYKEEEKIQTPLDITYQAIAELSIRQAEIEKENQELKEELKHLERS